MQTDFNQLYSRLGLEPGCSLHEFKQAYRRQFFELHPDRWSARALPPNAQEQLREIIALYGSALTFHRRYGRLPGALSPSPIIESRRVQDEPMTAVSRPTPAMAGEQSVGEHVMGGQSMVALRPAAPADDADQSTRRRRIAMALLALCVVVLVITWNWSAPTAPETLDEPVMRTVATVGSETPTGIAAQQIEIGLDKSVVRAIQGEPARDLGEVWEYGPSWVRFEDGRLVDWYSSPMNRLETSTTRPVRPAELPSTSQ